MDHVGQVTLQLYANVSGVDLEWKDPWGRTVRCAAGRGGSFAPSEDLSTLIGQGKLRPVHATRNTGATLRRSTDRVIP